MRDLSAYSVAARLIQSTQEITRKHSSLCWLVFTIVYAVGTLATSRVQPFEIDELITLHVARIPRSLLWSALAEGADGNPPVFHLLTKGIVALFGESELTLRLPAMIAFWILCLSLYLFVARRHGPLFGWISVLVLFRTGALDYATIARPYALILGFAALALVSWQLAAEGVRRRIALPALAIALAAATACHYYGFLIAFPLVIGEVVRLTRTGKLDFRVGLALAGGLVPLVFYLPLIRGASATYPQYLTSVGLEDIVSDYVALLKDIPLMIVIGLAIYLAEVAFKTPDREANTVSRFVEVPSHEAFAVIGFILLPAVTRIAATYTIHVYQPRYPLAMVLGLAVGLAIVVHSLASRHKPTVAVLMFVLVGLCALRIRHLTRERPEEAGIRLLESAADDKTALIAVEQGARFVPLSYYGPPNLVARLRYLASTGSAKQYMARSTVEAGMLGLRPPWTNLSIEDYESFVRSNKHFYVYTESPTGGWLISKLAAESVRVEVKAKDNRSYLFLVTLQQ
jgi:Dolichyl-phosphate-mannose-protein mannosyltransferase